ncbi:MAG: proline--tRNA ligase [Gammaproteobacteria bacterium]|nr:proline--tRNA ligase [Gammaproteobacteria bacterium]
MRLTQLPLTTLKETPADAEIISHQLMLRAGLVRRLSSGLFTWMPLGLRVLRRVERIVREEMNRAGALEILMPAVQPAELWQETGRWDLYGDLLLRIRDRHERDYCFAPTAEEVATEIARRELRSYRQLPVNYYQINTKFRDEIRPRFGVMRAREFVMKDAYSFHLDQASLDATYDTMADAYARIFTRLGLRFRKVDADGGEIGGSRSQEFHVLADSGEDRIAWCEGDSYAANVEMAPTAPADLPRPPATQSLARIATPGVRSIDEVAAFLQVSATQCLKTLVVEGTDGGLIALLLRGDHALNPIKAERAPGVARPLKLASPERILTVTGAPVGSLGPVTLKLPQVADHSALHLADFVCGANVADAHLTGINWERDLPLPTAFDLRNVENGDPSPGGGGALTIARGIEVGHIFQLGDKYSRSMHAVVLDQDGKERVMTMGCYGIGVSRIVGAAIEQNHDANGIVWPEPLSPFDVILIEINPKKSEAATAAANTLYNELQNAGYEVLFDDRDARPGVKFADADLVGIPHRIVVGERGVKEGKAEYRHRQSGTEEQVGLTDVLDFLRARREVPRQG